VILLTHCFLFVEVFAAHPNLPFKEKSLMAQQSWHDLSPEEKLELEEEVSVIKPSS
jgi:hypothetical protein